MNFVTIETRLGEFRVLELRSDSAVVRIAPQGATLLDWVWRGIPLLDGYRRGDELAAVHHARSAIMVPFSNRVRDGRYSWRGVEYDFLPAADDRPVVLHGLLRDRPWELISVEQGAEARVVLRNRELRPGRFLGYPFAVDVEVEYLIRDTGIDVEIRGTNVGTTTAPFASGWHPYFRIGDTPIDDLELTIPATGRIAVDAALLPLPGADAHVRADGRYDYRAPRRIGAQTLDAAYTTDTPARSTLRDPGSGVAIEVWQQGGLVHVYSADYAERDPRGSFAIEPVEFMTDAFNRPELVDGLALAPGEIRSFRFGVSVTR